MDKESTSKSNDYEADCPICLQPFTQPVKLPCNHIFCFLCAKGLVRQNQQCALCRKVIPSTYMNWPQFVVQRSNESKLDSFQWYYQGKSGWWQYDDETSGQIEHAYQNDEERCEVLIAGELYIIDFEKNRQILKSNPIRSRYIKRDVDTIPCKGIAGVPGSSRCRTSFQKGNDTTKKELPSKSSDGSAIIPNLGVLPTMAGDVGNDEEVSPCTNASLSENGNSSNVSSPKTQPGVNENLTTPLNVQTTSTDSQPSTPTEMSPNTAKRKCRNFLSTLIRLADKNPAAVTKHIRNLIQGIIDGTMQAEDFEAKLQKELNSAPQPYLISFLKKNLPYLRHSLITKELTIEGMRPPPAGACLLPHPQTNLQQVQMAGCIKIERISSTNETENNMKENQFLNVHQSKRLHNSPVDYNEQLTKRACVKVKEENKNDDPSFDTSRSTGKVNCNNLEGMQQHMKNFGAIVVSKLQNMSQAQKLYTENIINDALFKGLCGKLTENSYITEPSS